MTDRADLPIDLTDEALTLIKAQIASGRFANASEVIQAGLGLLNDETVAEQNLRELAASLEQQVEEREKALHDSMDFARLALSAVSGIGVWTYEVSSDCFYCDKAVAEVYGLDAEQAAQGIKRDAFLANVHPDDMPALRATMAGGLIRSGDLELEYRIAHPDGSVRWVLSRGHTYFDDAGLPVRRTGVGMDMTKQRLLEQQLRQSQKMEAVGQLTGGLAHDFNNLLAGISGSLEMIEIRLRQGRLNDLWRYIEAARGASRRAAALTHRLLAFSRRQPLDPSPTAINSLIAGMEELIRRTVGPAIEIEVVADAKLWMTLVDANQLENALLNLCINARDAMVEGGRIVIHTANVSLDEKAARERDLAPGQYVALSVADTGVGMTPDVVAHAFDPFFTTKPMGEGTGLGLSMIYGFVRQSGGQVRAYSKPGQGTTMRLYLPRHIGQGAQLSGSAESLEVPRAEQGETVLVIEDEPTVRMLVKEVLEDLGYNAIEATDGASGLEVLRSSTHIDLVVTDVGLPGGINGRQVADAGRALRPELKILFITGYAANAVVGNDQLDAGMHLLTKPFSVDVLADLIKKLIVDE
jgi:putative addiction module CopG family antidote